MFKCSAGHMSKPHEARILVATKIRTVENTHVIKNETDRPEVINGYGREVVEEKPYCFLHASQIEPLVVGNVQHKHEFKRPAQRQDK